MVNTKAATTVDGYLANYRPAVLARPQWKAAREQVIAAIRATNPGTIAATRGAISTLTVFLADTMVWDGRSELDLAGLLTSDTIDGFLLRCAKRGVPNGTLAQRRAALNRLSRAVHGKPLRQRRPAGSTVRDALAGPDGTPWRPTTAPDAVDIVDCDAPDSMGGGLAGSPAMRALHQLLVQGHSVTAATAAWSQWTGRGSISALRTVVLALPGEPVAGTVGDVGTKCAHEQSLRRVFDQLPEVSISGVSLPATPSHLSSPAGSASTPGEVRGTPGLKPPAKAVTKSKTKPGRVSRAAALRYAREQKELLDRLALAAVVVEEFDEKSLPASIVGTYERYNPQDMPEAIWCDIESLHRRLTLGYAPATPARVGNVATGVTAFLRFVYDLPDRGAGPVTVDTLLAPGLLDAWVATLPAATATSYRSMLRRALDSLTPAATPTRISYTPRPAPYSVEECRRFVRLVFDQPSVGRRSAGCLIVGLGLGAGLDGRDWRALRRHHIRPDELADGTRVLVVDIPASTRPARSVVIRQAYTALVHRGLAAHDEAGRGPRALLVGIAEDRASVLDGRVKALTTARGEGIAIDPGRLRNTWIVAALSANLPLPAVMHAAGLVSARTITDLLPYCTSADPELVAAAFAALPITSGVAGDDPDAATDDGECR